jgi:hypothetical protein
MDQKLLDKAMEASKAKTIKELFAEDPARAEKFTVSAAGWTLDYSKNRIDAEMMKALVKLAEKSDLKAEIEKMFTGKKINATEDRAVLHTALRNMEPKAKIKVDGKDVNNTGDNYVLPWIAAVKEIAPREVMIYTIDRETPVSGLQKASHEELDRIVELLAEEGIKATASY